MSDIDISRLDLANPFASEDITPPFNAEWQAKRRVADALRQLTEVLVTSSPSVEQMHGIAAQLEQTAGEFQNAPRIFGRHAWAASGEHGSFGQVSHELNPLAGCANPVAPPLNMWIEDEVAYGSCICGWTYEGPPNSVHGGVVSSIFDQFLGMTQFIGKRPGMTAYLHVNYHQRTPLNTELRLEGRYDRAEGRKNYISAEMYADGVRTASAEGLFVQPRGGMEGLQAQAARGSAGD
ncbi:MAG: thioesterase [Halioglobus sp.]|nr:thioesterase [Halioglobus sp.]|tara:strand:+ start:956 stop:1663 length:708 start_codon:yes stop_codon:yes gene_type:complete